MSNEGADKGDQNTMAYQVCKSLNHEDGWIVQELGFLLWAVLSLGCSLLTGNVHALAGWHDLLLVMRWSG